MNENTNIYTHTHIEGTQSINAVPFTLGMKYEE